MNSRNWANTRVHEQGKELGSGESRSQSIRNAETQAAAWRIKLGDLPELITALTGRKGGAGCTAVKVQPTQWRHAARVAYRYGAGCFGFRRSRLPSLVADAVAWFYRRSWRWWRFSPV